MIKKRGFPQIGVWIQEGIVLLACFFFLLLRVHPVLILESRPPVFFKGADFLNEFLKIPGGLVDWLSAFFRLFWFSDFWGALFLTLCFWLVALFTKKWLETLMDNRPIHTFHLIPVGLLLVLHSQYDFPLSVTLAVIINLFCLILFIRWVPKQQVVRAALALVVAVMLYWSTGGAFLMFAILGGLDDLLFRKQFASGLLLLLISAVLPIAAAASVFLVPLRQAYLHNLSFENPVNPWIAGYGLPAFYLLTLLLFSVVRVAAIQKPFQKITRIAYIWKWAAGTLLLLGGTFLLAQKSDNATVRLVLQVNRSVKAERWQDVLKLTQHYSDVNPLLSCQTNLALYQTGMLLNRMFSYPQTEGTDGLLMERTWCISWPEEVSNVYWKMGLVSSSQHWAHEAIEHKGATPDLLKRLGLVYMVKGDHEAANRFFLNLKNVPFQRKTAENLIWFNQNPSELAKEDAFTYIQSCMPVEDFISLGKPSVNELEKLLKRNPKNRMAFEYLIAFFLLNGNLKEIWSRISDFNTFGYVQIPRHVQEALILNAALTPKFDMNQMKNWIQPLIYKRFLEYRQILLKHQGNKNSARQELQARFSDTYWYYLLFVKLAAQQSESQNDYQ